MPTRTFAVAAAVGAAAFATTGITYASPAESTQAAPSVQRAVSSVKKAAPSAKKAIPATPPLDGGTVSRNKGEGGDRGGRDHEGRGGRDHEGPGYIYFNERTYSGSIEGCIAAASGLGANSFSIYNDSRRTVEVYRGFNCNGGSPVATVGPHGATNGVVTSPVNGDAFGTDALIAGAMFGDDGVVGSFRVVHDDEW
ncbi:hypothetical protein OHB41_24610 [Streptomyces sp. NBC_01571]|uniref:hypothetical protein n=1 Tax=Streptomyces sp. NBC_01571 TaxID=2975883 RepID=UPI0022528E58|nr:hypothetical protein [Streptomyces sp. NBC_01571]MCX4576301.1 hypothetical protein [Streptomyces sp. NBC_01571]